MFVPPTSPLRKRKEHARTHTLHSSRSYLEVTVLATGTSGPEKACAETKLQHQEHSSHCPAYRNRYRYRGEKSQSQTDNLEKNEEKNPPSPSHIIHHTLSALKGLLFFFFFSSLVTSISFPVQRPMYMHTHNMPMPMPMASRLGERQCTRHETRYTTARGGKK